MGNVAFSGLFMALCEAFMLHGRFFDLLLQRPTSPIRLLLRELVPP